MQFSKYQFCDSKATLQVYQDQLYHQNQRPLSHDQLSKIERKMINVSSKIPAPIKFSLPTLFYAFPNQLFQLHD